MLKKSDSWTALGRRKSSIARIKMEGGKGVFTVNRKPVDSYFGRETLNMVIGQPLELLELSGKFNITVNVTGGGLSGQAGAIRLAIARCIEKINPDYRSALKQAGMLTRDSREVERKKYGQPGARKKFQFSKR